MEIEYSLQETDLIVFAQFQIDHSPTAARRHRTRRWGYMIGFSLMAIGIYLFSSQLILPMVFAALAILSFILYPFFARWLNQRNSIRIVRERATPASYARRKLRATDEGLEQISENAESKAKWRLVDGIVVTPTHTFISLDGAYSVVIPGSQIEADAYEELVSIIRQHLENAR